MKHLPIFFLLRFYRCSGRATMQQDPETKEDGPTRANIWTQVSGIPVDDQEKALQFRTNKSGFNKKHNIPLGEYRWLTVVSLLYPDGTELVLEPNAHPAAAATFLKAIYADGIPYTALYVNDPDVEHKHLTDLGVEFKRPLTNAGNVRIVVSNDTCGNRIQVVQVRKSRSESTRT